MNHLSRLAVAVLTAAVATIPAASATAAGVTTSTFEVTAPGNPDAALYDGTTIDLSEGWGTARACAELGSVTECYDSLAELLTAHPELALPDATVTAGGSGLRASLLVDCATTLRLYNGTSYTGTVLILSTRNIILNLSSYGFDNLTSSYRVGACASNLYTGSNAGGSFITVGANTQAASMPSGFNNTVSSVFIG